MIVDKIISPSRENWISKIVYPKRNVNIPKMSNPELNEKLQEVQEYFNYLATRYRVGFSFTEVPLYSGCMVTCHKNKTMIPSNYITVKDDAATVMNKISEPVYSIVSSK